MQTINIEQFASCLRCQFVWDAKQQHWLIKNSGRDMFFEKELGLLVFIFLAPCYGFTAIEICDFLKIKDDHYRKLKTRLHFIFYNEHYAASVYIRHQKKMISTKSGLIRNTIFCNHQVFPAIVS